MSFLSSKPQKSGPATPDGNQGSEAAKPLLRRCSTPTARTAPAPLLQAAILLILSGGKHGQSSSAGKDTFSISDNKIVVPSGYLT